MKSECRGCRAAWKIPRAPHGADTDSTQQRREGRERGGGARAPLLGRVDQRRLAARRFAMLVEQGIEPHPGPAFTEPKGLTARLGILHAWHGRAAAARRDAAAKAACLAEEMRENSVYWCSLALQERSRVLELRCDELAVSLGATGTLRVRRSQWEGVYRDAPASTPDATGSRMRAAASTSSIGVWKLCFSA